MATKPASKAQTARKPLRELDLIRWIGHETGADRPRAARSRRQVVLGIGDDCAILRLKTTEDTVVTTDFSLEGRHFRRDWHSPQSIGHRCLARGLSDLAAMGARPVAAFLSLAWPRALAADRRWIGLFLKGFQTLAERTGTPLAGGDTAEAPSDQLLADIVLLGAVPRGRALRRDTARPGDRLFVTGSLGGAAAQLSALMADPPRRPQRAGKGPQPHFFPEPRLAAGQVLVRRRAASAAIDLSDGLSTDLRHLCMRSGVSAEVSSHRLPLSPLLARFDNPEAQSMALHGGEDYELLFTVPPGNRIGAALGGVSVTEIGRILAASGKPQVFLLDSNGKRKLLKPGGWEHLR